MRDSYLIISSIIILTLLTGCGVKDELWAPTNDTQNQSTTDKPIAPATEREETPETATTPTPQSSTQKLPPLSVAVPTMELSFDELTIYKPAYGEDEVYELRMIISATQKTQLRNATLSFTPDCRRETSMLITLNGRSIYTNTPDCEDETAIDLDVDEFLEGPNVIAFQQHVQEIYPLTGVLLLFTYADGRTESLPAADFTFKPSVSEEIVIRSLDEIYLVNSVTRTFSLKEEQVYQDLELDITASAKQGSLIILLNGYVIYDDKLEKLALRLTLPKQYLVVGKNNLEFIGIAE